MRILKVLYWVSPLIELDWPFQKESWVRDLVPRINAALEANFEIGDSLVCVGEEIRHLMETKSLAVPGRILAFSQRELLDDYTLDGLAERRRFFATGEASRYYGNLARRFLEKTGGDYRPDVIFSFNESPFLRKLYPEAIHLSVEHSVFSRRPYPRTYAFDPFSDGNSRRFLSSTMCADINAIDASPDDLAAIGRMRETVMEALTSNSAITEYFMELRRSFDHVILMPLGYERNYDTLVTRSYSGQFEFVEHVLDSVDAKTCILLTQHPTIHAIRPERVEELKAIHPNLRLESWFGSVENFSQAAMAYCDGCVVAESSLAYQAAFLGKHLISPDGFCEGIADSTDISRIADTLERPTRKRDNFFAWVLNHYAVDTDFIPEYLKAAICSFPRAESWTGPDFGSWPSAHPGVSLSALVDKWNAECVKPFLRFFPTGRLVPRDFDLSSSAQRTIAELRNRLESQQDELRRLFDDRDRIIADRAEIRSQLDGIVSSRVYQFVLGLQSVMSALIPRPSRLRHALAKVRGSLRRKQQ